MRLSLLARRLSPPFFLFFIKQRNQKERHYIFATPCFSLLFLPFFRFSLLQKIKAKEATPLFYSFILLSSGLKVFRSHGALLSKKEGRGHYRRDSLVESKQVLPLYFRLAKRCWQSPRLRAIEKTVIKESGPILQPALTVQKCEGGSACFLFGKKQSRAVVFSK